VNALAYAVFAVLFVICTGGVLGLALVAWLGWALGLMWTSVLAAFVMFMLWRLYRYARPSRGEIYGNTRRRPR